MNVLAHGGDVDQTKLVSDVTQTPTSRMGRPVLFQPIAAVPRVQYG